MTMEAKTQGDGDAAVGGGTPPTAGRWRLQRRLRIVVALVVVALVVGGLWFVVADQPWTGGPIGPAPPGGAFTLGTATADRDAYASLWYENMSVENADATLTLANLAFSVQASEGQAVTPPAGSEVQLISSLTGETVATFSFSTSAWTGAPDTTHVTNAQVVSLVWASSSVSDPLAGDRFVVTGQDGLSGSIYVTLA